MKPRTPIDPTRAKLAAFVHKHGGPKQAAVELGADYSTVRSVLNGHRGIGRDTALEWAVRSGGDLDAGELALIRPTKPRKGREAP